MAQRSGFRSILSVPLLHQGRAIGTIGVARREPGRFADSAVALLQTFARQAVIAIENVRLFNETQEALEHQTATSEVLKVIAASVDDAQPVFDKIIDSAAQLFPDALALMILQVDAQDMLHVAGIRFVGDASGPFSPEAARQREMAIAQAFPSPLAGTATELAIRTGLADIPDMHNATDVPGLQRFAKIIGFNFAALFAPLMWEGKGIGSIAMLSARLGPFGDKEHALLKTFADQAVIAIQNAKMFRETNEALERQTATAEILKVIASSPSDVQPVFDAIARSSNQLLGGLSTMVARIEDDALHLVAFTSTTPEGDAALQALVPDRAGRPSRWVRPSAAARSSPSSTPKRSTTACSSSRELARARGYRSMLFCPLVREGQSIGMISVTRREPGPFAPHQVALLQTFADQAVIAIENVRLFNETQESLQQQKASAEVLAVISNSMADAQPVFEKILDSCKHLFGGDELDVLLVDEQGMLNIAAYRGVARDIVAATFPAPVARTPAGRALARAARDALARPDRRRRRARRAAQDGQADRLPLDGLRADAVERARHRRHRRGALHRPLQAEGAGDAADLCRPGGDRDPERAAVQRDEGGAGAADRQRRGADGDRPVGVRCRAGVRAHPEQRAAHPEHQLRQHRTDRGRWPGACGREPRRRSFPTIRCTRRSSRGCTPPTRRPYASRCMATARTSASC